MFAWFIPCLLSIKLRRYLKLYSLWFINRQVLPILCSSVSLGSSNKAKELLFDLYTVIKLYVDQHLVWLIQTIYSVYYGLLLTVTSNMFEIRCSIKFLKNSPNNYCNGLPSELKEEHGRIGLLGSFYDLQSSVSNTKCDTKSSQTKCWG